MEVYKLHELFVMVSSALSGIVMGFVYDFFRAVKTCFSQKIFWLFDLLFWVFAGVIFYLFIYFSNNASLRWYEFVFCILGAVVYWFFASRFVLSALCRVVRVLKSFFRVVTGILKKVVLGFKRFFSPIADRFYNKKARTYYKTHNFFGQIRNKLQKKGKNNSKNI